MIRKLTLGSAVVFGLTFSAQSSAIVVGGVEIGPAPSGFVVEFTETVETVVTAVGDELVGIGRVNSINGNAGFCVTCAQLTYHFEGLMVKEFAPTEIVFTGGTIDFFVHDMSTYDPFNGTLMGAIDSATQGDLWLSLDFAELEGSGVFAGSTGSLFGSGNSFGTGNDNGTGLFNLDITGGLADVVAALDTNFFDVTRAGNIPGTTDFNADSSFGPGGSSVLPLTGTTTFRGNAEVVPEPAGLALLGIGLFGLAATKRRKA